MKDLLKEAIADAKTVRETALQNAKLALEEAFTPRLQSIISAQLQNEEEEMDDDNVEEAETETHETPEMETEAAEEETPEVADDETGDDTETELEDDDDVDLEEIIRELEGETELEELDSSDIGDAENKEPSADASDTADAGEIDLFELEDEDKDMKEGEDMADDEEVDLDEVIKSLREEEDEEEKEEETSKDEELKEAYTVIRFLKDKINEVNLLNAKLLYSNKLFKSYDLNENQKMKVIETFDRAASLREVKLVFSTLAESFNTPVAKKKVVKESFASKPVASTKPKTETVLTEGIDQVARFKKLAGLIK